MVDEYLELTEMVRDKAESGRRALGACLQRCRAEIGDVGVGVFQKLMGSLVESGMMYGVGLVIWNPLNVFSCVLSISSLGWAYFAPHLSSFSLLTALLIYREKSNEDKTYPCRSPVCTSNASPISPNTCLLYTSPSPRDRQKSRMPSSA